MLPLVVPSSLLLFAIGFLVSFSLMSIWTSPIRSTRGCAQTLELNSLGEKFMRFLLIRKADKSTEAGVMPSQQLLTDMSKYMQEMSKAGILLAGEGLQPSSKGSRVKFSSGKPSTVIDGPFAETKELIAGFSMIQVKSKQEAIEWVKRWPTLDADGNVEIEIRQLFEAEDFGPEFTPEMRAAQEKMRTQWDKKEN
jgi:hypothetical protein